MEDERVELGLDDRNRVSRLVGHKVAVVPGNGAGMVATLEDVRDEGIVLSEIDELGPGPTLICTWGSLRRLREPYFMPPHEAPESDEYYELYEHREVPPEEVAPEEVAPELPVERRRDSAKNLQSVVPIAQRRTVGGIAVALTSLELFEEGVGVLRYRISYEPGMFEGEIPIPELVVRDEPGGELPWSPQGGGSGTGEADGEVEICDLPETGELEIEVTRLLSLAFDEEAGEEVVEESYAGPWTFSFFI